MDILSEALVGSCTIKILPGYITACSVDAIFKATNSHLQHGGSVTGAIVRKGVSIIEDDRDRPSAQVFLAFRRTGELKSLLGRQSASSLGKKQR